MTRHGQYWCLLQVFLMAGLAVTAGAQQTLLIDLGSDESFRGLSVPNPDMNGNHWTSVWSGAFYQDIVDIDGNPTDVDFGFDGSLVTGTDSFNGPAGITDTSTLDIDVLFTDVDTVALGNLGGALEAPFDYYVSSRFQIQQLDPTKTYDLTFFGSHKFNNDDVTKYTVYTDATYTTVVDTVDLLVGSGPDHNRDMVATISGLAPQDSNILYVEFVGANGGNGYLNALQVVASESAVTGDFNLDSMWNSLDIDLLYDEIAAGTDGALFDMNGDGSVSNEDISGWLTAAGAQNGKTYLPGDNDLDGNVGGSDFTGLASNFGNSDVDPSLGPAYWGNGNYDGNGSSGIFEVGGSDFTALASNFGHMSVSSVPEPTANVGGCLLLILIGMLGNRTRR